MASKFYGLFKGNDVLGLVCFLNEIFFRALPTGQFAICSEVSWFPTEEDLRERGHWWWLRPEKDRFAICYLVLHVYNLQIVSTQKRACKHMACMNRHRSYVFWLYVRFTKRCFICSRNDKSTNHHPFSHLFDLSFASNPWKRKLWGMVGF